MCGCSNFEGCRSKYLMEQNYLSNKFRAWLVACQLSWHCFTSYAVDPTLRAAELVFFKSLYDVCGCFGFKGCLLSLLQIDLCRMQLFRYKGCQLSLPSSNRFISYTIALDLKVASWVFFRSLSAVFSRSIINKTSINNVALSSSNQLVFIKLPQVIHSSVVQILKAVFSPLPRRPAENIHGIMLPWSVTTSA